jgi:preprotein translocase subunit SecB
MKKETRNIVTLPDLLATLQLDRYLVDQLTFKCNAASIDKKTKLQNPTVSVDFDIKENKKDKNEFLVEMVVDLNEGPDFDKTSTYQIHIHLYGWFRFTTAIDQETKARMLATNASSILYGVARSAIANLTGNLGSERFILPSLNLLAVVKAKAAASPARAKAL